MWSIPSPSRNTSPIFTLPRGHKTRQSLRALIIVLTWALFPLCLSSAHSAQVTLTWEQGPGLAPAGYAVFVRQEGQSYDYSDAVWKGTETSCTISGLEEGIVYYFVSRAFDLYGDQTENSNEICYTPQNQEPPAGDGSGGVVLLPPAPDESDTLTPETPQEQEPPAGNGGGDTTQQEEPIPGDPGDESSETGNDPPATGGGGAVGPLPPSPDESDTVTPETPVESNVALEAGVTLDNTGETLAGHIILGRGAGIDGGTVVGTLTGQGEGATITNAVIDVTSVSGVTFGFGCKVTQRTVDAQPGLDLTGMISEPEGFVQVEAGLVLDETGREWTTADLVRDLVRELLQDDTVTVQADDHGVLTVSARTLGEVIVPGKVNSVATGPWPDGVMATETGEFVFVKRNVAITAAPAWVDAPAFSRAVEDLGLRCDVGDNGVATIELNGGTRLLTRPCNTAILSDPTMGYLQRGGVSFSFQGDSTHPETFLLSVIYPDRTSQKLLPFLADPQAFGDFVKAMAFDYSINGSTGIVSILDSSHHVLWRGIPSYTLERPVTALIGIHIESAGDVNRDGLLDFYVVTGKAKQLIFTLP